MLRSLFPAVWVFLLGACASLPTLPSARPANARLAGRRALIQSVLAAHPETLDGFEALLRAAGLPSSSQSPDGSLSPEEAAWLQDVLLVTPTTLRNFGPRLTASFVLREVSEGEGAMARDFDGFRDGVLLDAKGPGYAGFLDKYGRFDARFQGAKKFLDRAESQTRAAKGLPIRWDVAEEKVAAAIRQMFEDKRIRGIEVVHTPAVP